jgi:hypothetical protein
MAGCEMIDSKCTEYLKAKDNEKWIQLTEMETVSAVGKEATTTTGCTRRSESDTTVVNLNIVRELSPQSVFLRCDASAVQCSAVLDFRLGLNYCDFRLLELFDGGIGIDRVIVQKC